MSRRGGQRATGRQEVTLPCFTLSSREIAHRLHRYRTVPTSVLDHRPGRMASAASHTVPTPLVVVSAKQERAMSASLPLLIADGRRNVNERAATAMSSSSITASSLHIAPHLRPRRHPLLSCDDWPEVNKEDDEEPSETAPAASRTTNESDNNNNDDKAAAARYETWLAEQCPIGPWRALVYDEVYSREDAERRYYLLKYSKRDAIDIEALIHGEAAALAERAAEEQAAQHDEDDETKAKQEQQQDDGRRVREADKKAKRRAATPQSRVRQSSSLRRRVVH